MEQDLNDLDDRDLATKFVELLTTHQRDLYAYINTLLLGNAAASDVLQDTNLDLWSRLSSFDFNRPFLPWAYGFAFQRVMAYRKSQYRSRLIFDDAMVSIISDAYTGTESSANARLAALRTCLDKLERGQYDLIRERYVGRLTVNALASRLGGSSNQISAKLYRIRKTLAKCIETTMAAEMRR